MKTAVGKRSRALNATITITWFFQLFSAGYFFPPVGLLLVWSRALNATITRQELKCPLCRLKSHCPYHHHHQHHMSEHENFVIFWLVMITFYILHTSYWNVTLFYFLYFSNLLLGYADLYKEMCLSWLCDVPFHEQYSKGIEIVWRLSCLWLGITIMFMMTWICTLSCMINACS